MILREIIAFLGASLIGLLHATLRVKHINSKNVENYAQYILSFWHAHLLLMLHARYRRPVIVMISQSKDGELIASTFQYYNVDAARGSSTRGGTAAMRDMLKAARNGSNIVFTPDGPKGPPRVLKDGVVYAAQITGLPIIPVAFAAKKKSYWGHGTGWSCRCRSRGQSSSTATRYSFREMATSSSGVAGSK